MIKFRVWDKKLKKMWPGIELEKLLRYLIFQSSPNSDAYCAFKDHFEDMVFQQFTGLTDKNGVEIYEGDRVLNEIKGHYRITQTIKNRGIVKRDRAHFGIKWISGATHWNIYWDDMMINGTKHLEVISSIHDKQEDKNE